MYKGKGMFGMLGIMASLFMMGAIDRYSGYKDGGTDSAAIRRSCIGEGRELMMISYKRKKRINKWVKKHRKARVYPY